MTSDAYVPSRDDHFSFDIPPDVVAKMPTYYQEAPATPSWSGNPSIDSYVGPMNGWPVAWGLLRDADLKARMARQ